MTSSPFKMTYMIWLLPRVSHLIYLSITPRVSMYHLVKQFLHFIILEVVPSALRILIATRILELRTISDNLNWNIHHDAILSKAYRTLGLVWRTFSSTIPISATVKLYTSLIRSQVLYCCPVWRSYLIKDIKKLEQLQRRATNYILRDYNISDYKTWLIHLRLFPLMYIFEISDILFLIKTYKHPTNNFNINTYISFSAGNTKSCGVELRHNASSINKEYHFYFNRIIRLWNSLPIIDLNLPINVIKSKIKDYFWQHFITDFDPDNIRKLHYLCPCGSCINHHSTSNYHHL